MEPIEAETRNEGGARIQVGHQREAREQMRVKGAEGAGMCLRTWDGAWGTQEVETPAFLLPDW